MFLQSPWCFSSVLPLAPFGADGRVLGGALRGTHQPKESADLYNEVKHGTQAESQNEISNQVGNKKRKSNRQLRILLKLLNTIFCFGMFVATGTKKHFQLPISALFFFQNAQERRRKTEGSLTCAPTTGCQTTYLWNTSEPWNLFANPVQFISFCCDSFAKLMERIWWIYIFSDEKMWQLGCLRGETSKPRRLFEGSATGGRTSSHGRTQFLELQYGSPKMKKLKGHKEHNSMK